MYAFVLLFCFLQSLVYVASATTLWNKLNKRQYIYYDN
jgi:hypothetical protein